MNTSVLTKRYKMATMTLGVMVLCLFTTYIYLVCASVAHVVVRVEAEQGLQDIRSEISRLEGAYILAQHRVSEKIANLDGYTSITEKVYIDRNEPGVMLSANIPSLR